MHDELDLRKRLQAAVAECFALQEEVRQLKELLAQNSIALPSRKLIASPGCMPIQAEIAQVSQSAHNQFTTGEAKASVGRALGPGSSQQQSAGKGESYRWFAKTLLRPTR